MPELPEVETIRLQLKKYFVGHKVTSIDIKNPKIFPEGSEKLIGAKVKNIRRFGKVLVFDFDNGQSIITHIKLTGQYIYRGPNLQGPPALSEKVSDGLGGKHTHVIFHLDRGGALYYNDMRRFGYIKVVPTAQVETFGFIKNMGPEPYSGLTEEKFTKILSGSKRPVKVVIMDQAKMGGVGNIYANDALWLSQIDPKRPANSLSAQEQKGLYDAIHEVLKNGMKYGGASELSFVTPNGTEGQYQAHTLAYGRAGELCPRCKKEKFRKIALGGRGTYFCPHCQK
jgi:formamidopyrimidine-DNA glycosylase